MMAEGKTSGGPSKSSTALGDLTNRIGKRGFSGKEKNGTKSLDYNDKDVIKRICVSSPPTCMEINSLKGNVISGLSKISNENRDPDVSDFGGNRAVSKNSIHVDNDCGGGFSLKGKHVVMGNSKVHEGIKDTKIFDLKGGDVVSQSVNQLDVGNGCGKLDAMKENMTLGNVEVLNENKCPSLEHSVTKSAVGTTIRILGNVEVANENKCPSLEHSVTKSVVGTTTRTLGNVEVVNENKCPSLENSVTKSAVETTIIGGGEFVPGSSKELNKENVPNLFDLGRSIEAHCESAGSFRADTSRTTSESGNDCSHDGKNRDAGEVSANLDDHNADNYVLSQSGSVDCMVLPESLESRVCGVGAHMSGKACSCSFCTKAAYIWLDLNYQDVKARLSVMKKSQKDAIILAERSSRIKVTEKNGAESFTRVSKLESNLIYQWRSLFQRMADIWEGEGNQLETSLLPLTNLIEKCKTDLELINAKMTEEKC